MSICECILCSGPCGRSWRWQLRWVLCNQLPEYRTSKAKLQGDNLAIFLTHLSNVSCAWIQVKSWLWLLNIIALIKVAQWPIVGITLGVSLYFLVLSIITPKLEMLGGILLRHVDLLLIILIYDIIDPYFEYWSSGTLITSVRYSFYTSKCLPSGKIINNDTWNFPGWNATTGVFYLCACG